jgi:Suppressor of fused protein (SUFU)
MSDEQLDPDNLFVTAIGEHVTRHVGPVTDAFHERVSDVVRVDLLVVGPHDGRPFTTLVTCGMSELPMRVPLENPDDLGLIPELRFAELLLALPPDWPLTPDAFRDEANYWPLRWLKRLARLPHQMEGWLGLGHTVPNGDPLRPLAPGVPFAGWLIDEPVRLPKDVLKLRVADRVINFYAAVPLTAAEMEFKVHNGGGALAQLLDRAKVSELIDVNRADVTAL